MNNKTAGLVVLYNPSENVEFNVETYINQISDLLVFDNSEAPNINLHHRIKKRFGGKVKIVSHCINFGIAKALNTGVEWALENKFTWLLTMDQDSSFSDDLFFKNFELLEDTSTIAIFCPNHKINNCLIQKNDSIYTEETIVMTSGNLINLELVKRIGLFTEKLFIDEVDHDFCLRAKRKKYRVVRLNGAILNHNLGSPLVENTINSNVSITSQHPPTRIYYITRNNFYIFKTFFWDFPMFVLKRVFNIISLYKSILIHQNNRKDKLRLGVLGFYHFLLGRYGKL